MGSSQSGAAMESGAVTPKHHWKERKGLPCPVPAQAAPPGAHVHKSISGPISFSKRKEFTSKIQKGGKKEELSILLMLFSRGH